MRHMVEKGACLVRRHKLRPTKPALRWQKRHAERIGGRISMNEIKDAVSARVQPRGDACPRHLALRRVGHSEGSVTSRIRIPRQIGQPSLP